MSAKYKPGYYGKLPQRGDFIKSGLSPALISRWDSWLSDGLEYSKDRLGDDWLQRYLHAPVWRFYISPGVLDKDCCIGVFFPSVDKVGRYFPFTLSCVMPDMPHGWLGNERVENYYSRLEKIGMVALDEACEIEDMEEALADSEWPFPNIHRAQLSSNLQWNGPEEDRYKALSNHFFNMVQNRQPMLTLWWTSKSAGNIEYIVNQGMPDSNEFIQFL